MKSKYPVLYNSARYAIYSDEDLGPTFGFGHNLCIQDEANEYEDNYADIGSTFELPEG
jgi:hypothetical protein